MNQVSNSGRGMTATELEDMTHLRLLATSFPSRARINLYRRCSEMVFLPVRQAGLPLRLVSPKSQRGLPKYLLKKAMRLVFPSLTFPRKMTLSIFFSNGILSLTKMKCLTLFKFNSMAFADWL